MRVESRTGNAEHHVPIWSRYLLAQGAHSGRLLAPDKYLNTNDQLRRRLALFSA